MLGEIKFSALCAVTHSVTLASILAISLTSTACLHAFTCWQKLEHIIGFIQPARELYPYQLALTVYDKGNQSVSQSNFNVPCNMHAGSRPNVRPTVRHHCTLSVA